MAHSTHTASRSPDALQSAPQSAFRWSQQSLVDAVARRLELVRRLHTAGAHRRDPAIQQRIDGAVAEANAALGTGPTDGGPTGGGPTDDIATDRTDRLEVALRALDTLTFELCEE